MTRASLAIDAAAATTWDAIVLGAGPAGSLAARQLASEGARVLLVDKKPFPRPKVCGACLNGRALGVLRSVGLGTLPASLGGVPLDSFALRVRGRETRLPLPAGIALSRSRFDKALADAAVAAGATFAPGVLASVEAVTAEFRRVRLITQDHTAEVCARVVLVAAGLGNVCLVHEAGIHTSVAPRSRVGAGCVVEDAPPGHAAHTIHMAAARGGYVGLVRVEDGALNVAAALDPHFVKQVGVPGAAAAVLAEAGFAPIPSLARADWRGTAPLTRRTRPLAGARLFLIGDAAGYVEPFTGEGMAWALASAAAVAPLALRAAERWEPALGRQWAQAYREIVGGGQRFCRALALLLRYPRLAATVFTVVGRAPALAGPFLRQMNAPPLAPEASGL